MGNIIDLLEEKNHFLQKFIKLNEDELISINEGNFDNLDNFYNSRESLLGILGKIDKMIENSNNIDYVPETFSNEAKKRALAALDFKNELVSDILSQDLQILSAIEVAKSDIIKELSQVKSTRKAFKSYKSGNQKRTLDEKI